MTFIDSNVIIPSFKKEDEYKEVAETFFENPSYYFLSF